MYLKEIRAQGFKSFADKVVINLSDNITGIVGPNGSGKSNVVDAVRWVLGEQSVKSLRGTDNMTDVIFSGSKSRGSLNVASVTLVFDNSDKYLNVSYSEVAIKRRVYRDGTNEYFINNERCRLKDIIEIMLDTGIAKESFNIISQGKIEEILSSKPNERRVIFEEAAGVLKYKKRKEEALRKLEKTNDNMTRVNDIINELEIQVIPLKEQKEKAQEYLNIKDELEKNDITLIAHDIKKLSEDYKNKKLEIELLKEDIFSMSTQQSKNDADYESLKFNVSNIANLLSKKNRDLLELTTKVEKLNSRKQIILERKKYEVEDIKMHQNLIELQERQLKLQNEMVKIDNDITLKNIKLTEILSNYKIEDAKIIQIRKTRKEIENDIYNKNRNLNTIKNKIEVLKDTIENNGLLPTSIKKILDNPKLVGVHNIISNIIEVDEIYATAINTALGANANNIIVDNENCARDAIEYLKVNNLGRATFFPLSIIKEKFIDENTIIEIKNMNGFIGVASELVKCDTKFENIIKNQLGNVIVCENITNANYISKKTNHRFRIITLDGQVLHVGGSLTGGSLQSKRNSLTLKFELEDLQNNFNKGLSRIQLLEDNINTVDFKYQEQSDKLYLLNKEKLNIENDIFTKRKILNETDDQLILIKQEINSLNNLQNNSISKEEEEIIKEYYEYSKHKDLLAQEIVKISNDLEVEREKMETFAHKIKNENSLYNQKCKDLNLLEIEINRSDVKLDNLLSQLSENYNLTFEFAVIEYPLLDDERDIRNRLNNLKRKIKDIGMVNINAIEEFERVSERYEFLIEQREDLIKAEKIILEIINEMDNVMKEEFKKTFEIIKNNFKQTFVELFNGGKADLILTNPEDILETGIEIIASPPGKKLSNISLLSGGEKTFTAISLLFAILKSRPVPFCILDEVEAALDDANVNSFGEYLKRLQQQTQFILITHKKRTMEFVDTLYGITMQESGVSKLVSVKLEELAK